MSRNTRILAAVIIVIVVFALFATIITAVNAQPVTTQTSWRGHVTHDPVSSECIYIAHSLSSAQRGQVYAYSYVGIDADFLWFGCAKNVSLPAAFVAVQQSLFSYDGSWTAVSLGQWVYSYPKSWDYGAPYAHDVATAYDFRNLRGAPTWYFLRTVGCMMEDAGWICGIHDTAPFSPG